MENIELKVTKTTISVTNQYILNQGEYNVDKCVFDFSDDYNDLIKKAVFAYNDEEPIQMVILENECNIPYELLQVANEFTLKVYAYEVQNDELVQRYSPTPLKIFLREGSYQGSNEVITPSQFEQYEAKLDEGLKEVDDKLEVVDETLETMNTAINEANTLNIDVSDKVNKDVTITLTRKDNTTKSVVVSDGDDFQYNWDGTKLGVKTDKEQSYTYVDLEGPQGPIGPRGEAFQIKKTYNTIQEMIADYNNMQINDYVMISGSVEQQDNATLWVKTETEDPTYKWVYLADFSGASGIQGPTGATPNIQIGNVTSGDTPNVTRRGTDENPILDFTLVKGEQGIQGEIGNGIVSIEKTSTSGLIDTYTITYDNGDTDTFDVTNGADGNVTDVQVDGTSVVDNGVANIEGINKLKQDIEMYKMLENALPKVEDTGENITLDNTAQCPMKMGFKGNTYQYSTTGKNKLEPKDASGYNGVTITPIKDSNNNIIYFHVSGTATNNISVQIASAIVDVNTNYFESGCASGGSSSTYYFDIYTYTGSTYVTGYKDYGNGKGFTTNNEDNIKVYLNVKTGTSVNFDIKPQLELGTSATDWEEYTGNSPSPSPSYPQDIHIVSGDNTINVCGKNLVESKHVTDTLTNFSKVLYTKCDLQADTTYYISFVGTSGNKIYPNESLFTTSAITTISTGRNVIQVTTKSTISTSDTSQYNATYGWAVFKNGQEQTNANVFNDLMISTSSDTTYEPYSSYTKEINLGELEVGGIGEYEDEFIKNTGKNLFSTELEQGAYSFSNGVDLVTSDKYVRTKTKISVKPNTTYTLSLVGSTSYAGTFLYYKEDNTFIGASSNFSSNITFTTDSNTYYIHIDFYKSTGLTPTDLTNLMLNDGSVALPYEPFGKGVWYLKKNIGKVVLDETNYYSQGTTGTNAYYLATTIMALSDNTIVVGMSNMFAPVSFNNRATGTDVTYSQNGRINLRTANDTSIDWSSEANCKSWLNTNQPVLYYILATPTFILLNDTLQETLDSFISEQGQTNISQENNDLPFVIKASAIKDISNL